MNRRRLIPALFTGLTLLACVGWLCRAAGPRVSPVAAEPTSASVSGHISSMESAAPQDDFPHPIAIFSLPFAALDNTCFDGVPRDLSEHTGFVSGGPAREYAVTVARRAALHVRVEPRSDYFDPSLVLLAEDGKKILASDESPAGHSESATTELLAPGVYHLFVGGYFEDCGPYQLTVLDEPPPLAAISAAGVHYGRNGAVVRWKSFAEVDVAHFELFRVDEGGRRRIAVLRAHGSPAGFADYRFTDRTSGAIASYELIAVARDGRREIVPVSS